MVIPEANVIPIPDHLSDDAASVLDPLGNAVSAVFATEIVAKHVVVTGAGAIGILAAKSAYLAGAHSVTVTEISPAKLEVLKKAAPEVDALDVREQSLENYIQSSGKSIDVAIECSGSPVALSSIVQNIAPGGYIALLGILPESAQIDWQKVIFKGLQLQGINGRIMYKTWYQCLALLERSLNLESIITHHMPIREFKEGFRLMEEGLAGRVVFDVENGW